MVVMASGSILFCMLTIWRLFVYRRKYHLPENKYTKLFRIATKEHFAILYVMAIGLNAFFGIWFAFTL
jgi:hypothetical protein